MVVYHVYSGGQDEVQIVELSLTRPRTKVLNLRTRRTYWVANTHLVATDSRSGKAAA